MFEPQIKDTYNQIAEYFSKTREEVWPETKTALKKLKNGDQILDLGCGNGRLLKAIDHDVNYTGIDFSEELIRIAEKNYPDAKFIRANLTKKQSWSSLGKFDAIFCVSLLHHLPFRKEQLFIVRQARKHLKENGFLYVSVWNLWKLRRIKHHFKHGGLKLKLKNWRWINTLFHNKYRMFCFAMDKWYLTKLLEEAGFNENKVYYSDRKGMQTYIFKGMNICSFSKKT